MVEEKKIPDEAAEKACGGSSSSGICPSCHKYVTITYSGDKCTCGTCGYTWTISY